MAIYMYNVHNIICSTVIILIIYILHTLNKCTYNKCFKISTRKVIKLYNIFLKYSNKNAFQLYYMFCCTIILYLNVVFCQKNNDFEIGN